MLSRYRTLLAGTALFASVEACALVANLEDERKPFPTWIDDSGADVAQTDPDGSPDGSRDGSPDGSPDGSRDGSFDGSRDSAAEAETGPAPDAGTDFLGMGYDMLQATLLSPCVTYDAAIDEPDSGAPVPSFQITTFTSTRELRDALELSPAERLAAEGGHTEPRANYVTANPVDETIAGLLISAKAAGLVTTAHAPRLTAAAAALLASDPAKFRTVCGDAFVAGVEAQSMFRAVLHIPSYGGADLTDLRNVPLSALTIDELIASVGVRAMDVWSQNEGLFAANAQPCTDLPCVRNGVNAILANPPLTHAGGRPIFATYASLPNAPSVVDVTPTLQTLGVIDGALGSSRDNAASLATILAHPTRFAPFDAQALTAEHQRLVAGEAHFQAAAIGCAKNATTCKTPTDDPGFEIALPARFEPVNLVADPGFEKQTTNYKFDGTMWSGYSADPALSYGADVGHGYSHTGANNGFADLEPAINAVGKVGMATTVSLEPHTRYAVRTWILVKNTDEVGFALKTSCADATSLAGIDMGTVHHADWELRSFEVDSGDLTSATVCIEFNGRFYADRRFIQVDDVTVVKIPL